MRFFLAEYIIGIASPIVLVFRSFSLFLINFGQMEQLFMSIIGDLQPGGEAPLVAGMLMGLAGVHGGK